MKKQMKKFLVKESYAEYHDTYYIVEAEDEESCETMCDENCIAGIGREINDEVTTGDGEPYQILGECDANGTSITKGENK